MTEYQQLSQTGGMYQGVDANSINPAVVNSYEVKAFSIFGWIKFLFGFLILFPIRLVLTVGTCVIVMILYIIDLPFIRPADQPQNWFIRHERWLVSTIWGRLVLFINGFFYIKEYGKLNSNARLVIANHSSCLDMFFFLYKCSPSFVVAEFVGKNFFLGPLARVTNCPVIDRNSTGNSGAFLQRLKARLASDEMSRQFGTVVLFPEGSTSNGQCLNYFHSGAFVPGEPLQPIVLRYRDSITPTQWSVRSWPFHFLVMMCNITNNLEVTYLPLYYPSAAEKEDARLYAQNVKNAMSRSLAFHSSRVHYYADPHIGRTAPAVDESTDFIPQTTFTYRDRKQYERQRKALILDSLPIPQPKTQREISFEHISYCRQHLPSLNYDQYLNKGAFFSQSSDESTPLSPSTTLTSSQPPYSSESVESGMASSFRQDSTSNIDPKNALHALTNADQQGLVSHSGLLFLLDTPNDAADYHFTEYHSTQAVPPDEILNLVHVAPLSSRSNQVTLPNDSSIVLRSSQNSTELKTRTLHS